MLFRSLAGKLSGSQAAYSNWQEGGLNTLAVTAATAGEARRTTANWVHRYEARLAFGLVKQDTLDLRKAEDVLRLGAALQYRGDGFFRLFNPTVAATVRSQFAPGFNYDEVPSELQAGDAAAEYELPVKVSDFLSPGVFTQSLGLTYSVDGWFTQRLGVAAKETVVLIERLGPLYGLEPGERVLAEVGVESRSEFDREIVENVRLKSSLGLFAAFNNPDLPDLLWENVLTMQVNSWLGVDLDAVFLYDRDISSELQIREVLSLGITMVLL